MASIAQPWLINKIFDPVFSIAVGFSAAALRIKREQTAKYPLVDNSYPALWKKTQSMSRTYFGLEKSS